MSLLLSWETPPELYDALRAASSAQLHRIPGSGLPSQLVADGLSWGFYEDEGNNDPTASYTVTYTSSVSTLRICDVDIRRWVRPADTCRIDFTFVRPDSAPWSGRRLKLRDIPGHGWVRDLWTGKHGRTAIVLTHGARIRLEIEGMMEALEFVVPHEHRVDWTVLPDFGTWVRVDARAVR